MLLPFIRDKKLTNTLFVCIFLPYIVFCLTVGGFHDILLKTPNCNHALPSVSRDSNDPHIETTEGISHHNSETCQICQWLKTPSTIVQFLSLDTQFTCVCVHHFGYSNPVTPSLTIHKFTIRPPPSFSCFSA